MKILNNYQSEIDTFRKNFSRFQEKKIVLYGIGRYTATLLSGITGFHFVGLMDRDQANIGKILFGLPVLSKKEAETEADMVIINTAENYWKLIYTRIKQLGIPIYFRNGQMACDQEERSYLSNKYWDKNGDELRKKVKEYDIISFDIFDTLVMRKAFILDDIFKLAALRIKKKWNINNFYKERIAAEKNYLNMTLDEIYEKMNVRLQLSKEILEQIKETEIQVEMENIVPRTEMIEILNGIEEDKTVYLISDMYLSSDLIKRILKQCGVKRTQNIWISSEQKKRKKNGELWEKYKQEILKGRRALHIGDNSISDVEMPQKYGIDTYQIMSAADMLKESSAGSFASSVESLGQSVFAGLLCAKVFNSPFALNRSRGQVLIEDFETLGYCVFGGVIFSFLMWLVEEAKNMGIERLLFLARDGYWLRQNYDYLAALTGQPKFPESEYLAISRRLVLIASFRDEDDLKEIICHPYSGIFSEYLYDRLNLDADEDDIHKNEQVNLPQDYDKILEWLKPYDQRMVEKIKEEKENYLLYLEKHALNETDGIVDLWFYGSNQYYLMKTVGKKLMGFYFAVNKDKCNRCGEWGNCQISCFQKEDDPLAEACNIYKSNLWIESFLTAPYGMIKAVEQDGGYVCDQGGMNQKFWECRKRMYDGICKMERDYLHVFEGDVQKLEPSFIDCFWGEVMTEHMKVSDDLKKVFFYDNRIVKRWEESIFE